MPDRTDHPCPEHDSAASVARRDAFLAERRAELQADAPPVIPPCPAWCVSTAALHPLDFDDVKDGMYVRTHEAYCGDIVTVLAVEHSDGHGGPVTFTEPLIRMHGADYDSVPVTPAQAVALAADINRARTVLDHLTAPTTVPPCPSWCTRPAGHGYSDVSQQHSGSPVFEREHSTHTDGDVFVNIVAGEHYLRGNVYVDCPVASMNIDKDSGWFSSGLRELAAEMLERAELLDRIMDAHKSS